MSIAKLSRVLMAGLILFAAAANAQTAQRNAADAALVDRVKDTVMKELREIGLDKTRFASCLASGRHDRQVEEDYQNAVASGGRGTPWSIIVSKNGKTYPLSGAQPYAAVKQLIELALQEK